ncbi:hypothetical protein CJU89_2499 [Yarrowia sp. B02]|nr:hypothetical protein CJU89_2499 [Yarrowia sp. B02]
MRVLQELPLDVEKENCDPAANTPMPRILAGFKRLVGAETVAVHAEVHKQQSSADTEPSSYSKVSSTLVNHDSSPGTSVQSQDPDEKPLRDCRHHGRSVTRDKISVPSFTLVTRVSQLDSRVSTEPGQHVSYQLKMSACITVPDYPRVQASMTIFIDNSAAMTSTEFARALDTAASLYTSASAFYPRLYVFNDHPRHVRIEHLRDTTPSMSAERDITGAVSAIFGDALDSDDFEPGVGSTLPRHVMVISSASLSIDNLLHRVQRLHIHTMCVTPGGFIARTPFLDSPRTCGWVMNTCPQSLSLFPLLLQCLQVGLVIEPLRNLRISFESNGWEPIDDELIPCFYPGMYLERMVQYVLDKLPEEHVAQAPYGNNLGAVESLEAALGIYFIKTGLLTVSYEMSGVEGLVRREHPLHTKRFEFDDDLASPNPAVSQADATALWRNLDVGYDPSKR